MAQKRIIVIGAGIAGLATGCYALMNGYDTRVFEMSAKPGGLCTAWQRAGFTFDFCIHNLAGAGRETALRRIWDELGALAGVEVIDFDVFVRIENTSGEGLNFYTDLSRLEAHLKEIAPEDSPAVEQYIKTVRSLANLELFAMAIAGPREKLRVLPHMFSLAKYGRMPLDVYAERFTNPLLRRAFGHVQYDITGPDMPTLPHLIFMAGLDKGDLGWPRGGSLEFSLRITKRLEDLGGTIHYRSPVEKILVNGNRAAGIRLLDGTEHYADIVVSAADGFSTIFGMLGGQYTNTAIDSYYTAYPANQAFGLQVYLGLNREFSDEPHALTLLFDRPFVLDTTERDSLFIELFGPETGLAPKGKSVMKVVTTGNYDYWVKLRENANEYRSEKEGVCQTVLQLLEQRFPGLTEQVEVTDVTTPVTAQRYTNNFHGWQPWPPKTGAQRILRKGLSKTLPGLDDFYMVGQWAGAMIGVTTVAAMGRNLVKDICRREGNSFRTTVLS